MLATTDVRDRRPGIGGRIEAAWTDVDSRASTALAPAEALYRTAVAIRNRAFDAGLLRARRAAVPVISVGNLVVGGTGKTPFTRWLVAELRARGEKPGILHGGYADDEPELHRRWNPDLPVVAGRDRVRSAAAAVGRGATILVLDDAFQHRRIARDLDLLLVPAETWTERPRLLPRGPWREPVGSLERADLIVVTRRTASAEAAANVVRAVAARCARRRSIRAAASPQPAGLQIPWQATVGQVAQAWLRADTWRAIGASTDRTDAPSWPDTPVVAVAGIARPDAFLANAQDAGGRIVGHLLFADHYAYTATDVARIRAEAAGRPIVTTEKDWIKLAPLAGDLSGWVLEQTLEFDAGQDLVTHALDAIRMAGRDGGSTRP